MTPGATSIADAFRTTLDLFDTGLDLMRHNLRQSHPEAGDWLAVRPSQRAPSRGSTRDADLAVALASDAQEVGHARSEQNSSERPTSRRVLTS